MKLSFKPLHLLLLIVILAIGLRLPLLTSSFWLDEAAQALESARPLAQQFEIIPDFQPPLLHIMLHFAMYVSDSEWWLRTIAAVIPGILSIWITYKIAERWKLPQTGVIAALLLSTSSLFIFYSQELRPYALPTLFAVLSWYHLLTLTQGETPRKTLILYALWTSLGLYASFIYPFLLISQITWMVVCHREQLKGYAAAVAAAIIAFIPWLPTFRLQLAAGGLLRQDLPGWSEVVSFSQLKSPPLVLGKFVFGVMNLSASPFFVVSGLILAILGSLIAWQAWKQAPRHIDLKKYQPEILVVCWLLVPLALAWVVSFWIPVIQPKRVLLLLPAFYLLIGLVINRLQNSKLAMSVLGVFLAINLISTANYYFNPQLQRENWRALHTEISQKYGTSDAVAIFAFPEPFAPWRWYDQNSFTTISTGYLVNVPEAQVRDNLKFATDKPIIIVFDYLTDLSDPQHKLLQAIESFGYQPIEVIDYPNIGFVRIYARPGMTVSAL